ncbi:MAG TPA: hypothetical protein VND64_23625, partial [Pirellulales bacterium]|nr:hypothetical protein [Pirellulales bacterium]
LTAGRADDLSVPSARHLPDEVDERLAHRLAIILDGRVNSAPFIRSRIDDRAQISGHFTEQEATRLADVLMAGELPVAVRKVGESASAP